MQSDAYFCQLKTMSKIARSGILLHNRTEYDHTPEDGTYYLWDEDISPLCDEWQPYPSRLSDSLRNRHADDENLSARQLRGRAADLRTDHDNAALDEVEISDDDYDERVNGDRSALTDRGNGSPKKVSDEIFSDERDPSNLRGTGRIRPPPDAESVSSIGSQQQGLYETRIRNNEMIPTNISQRAMAVDEIMLCYWRIQKRLVVTSLAFQRWTIAWLLFLIIWSAGFVLMWLKHRAELVEIAQFIMPALIVPILCSAYAEVNFEGQRLLVSIFPNSERIGMLSLFFMQPLYLNTYGFMLNYSTIITFLSAVVLAASSRVIIDELTGGPK